MPTRKEKETWLHVQLWDVASSQLQPVRYRASVWLWGDAVSSSLHDYKGVGLLLYSISFFFFLFLSRFLLLLLFSFFWLVPLIHIQDSARRSHSLFLYHSGRLPVLLETQGWNGDAVSQSTINRAAVRLQLLLSTCSPTPHHRIALATINYCFLHFKFFFLEIIFLTVVITSLTFPVLQTIGVFCSVLFVDKHGIRWTSYYTSQLRTNEWNC